MAKNSSIEWLKRALPDGRIIHGHTFSPWRGCTKVAPECAHCYADTMSKRNPKTLGVWGPNGKRIVAAPAAWREVEKWNAWAGKEGVRVPVFPSLCDPFEEWDGPMHDHNEKRLYSYVDHGSAMDGSIGLTMRDVRRDFFQLIDRTPHLDWLLLTKRPQNIRAMWLKTAFDSCRICGAFSALDDMSERERLFRLDDDEDCWECLKCGVNASLYRQNTWLVTSAGTQETANKFVAELLECRGLAPVLGVSAEPLLGDVDLTAIRRDDGWQIDALRGIYSREYEADVDEPGGMEEHGNGPCLDWVIVGGESGPGARPCNPQWVRGIVNQCREAGVPAFVKQMGSNVVTRNDMVEDEFNNGQSGWPDPDVEYDIHGFREDYQGADCRIQLRDKKGGDWLEWPDDLRVREFPERKAVS